MSIRKLTIDFQPQSFRILIVDLSVILMCSRLRELLAQLPD
jgi:hypothetical protein